MRKAYKSIIVLSVVLIAGLNFIVPAFAQDPFTAIAVGGIGGASGAGLFGSMAGISGIDISWSAGGSDPLDAMWNVLNPNHVYFSGEKHEANPQSDPEDIYDWINVDIGDWLQAQQDFISNFCEEYHITDNDSGTINTPLSYAGYAFDRGTNPLYGASLGGVAYGLNVEIGQISLYISDKYSGFYTFIIKSVNGNIQEYSENPGRFPSGTEIVLGSNGLFYGLYQGNLRGIGNSTGISVTSPTTVNYQSDTVNLDVFDGWESAKVKIPHSISQLQTGWTPVDFLGELNRIWSGAGEDNILIEDGSYVPPVPPTPIPDTPLGDVPFDDWVDLWGQGIYEQLENQTDALDFIGSNGEDAIEELESIDSNLGDIKEDTGSIDTNIGIGNGLLGGIKSAAETAVDYLEGIAEHVEELVEEIVEGTETLIAGILNQIPQVFSVIFDPIKQASSIWHYVVEWIQSIGAPFQFIWSMASGTSYYIILPVYASLAAAVVLAFYKRFGK